MYCQECGTKIEADSRFCRNCGVSVATGPSTNADRNAPVTAEPVFEEASAHGVAAELTSDPERAHELVLRAVQADMNGNLDEAMTLAEDAVRADPADARARSCLAGIYERLGRTADAVIQYEAAVALDPSNQLDRMRLRRLAPDREAAAPPGRPEQRPVLRWQVIVAAAAAFVLVIGVGLVGYFTVLRPKIVASDELALSASSDDVQTLLSRVRGYQLMGEYDNAETLLWQALRQEPDNAEARRLLTEVLAAKGAPGTTSGATPKADSRVETAFPSDESQALGAVIGVRDSLQPNVAAEASLPLPGTTPGLAPGANFPAPSGTPLGGLGSMGSVLPPDAAPNTITPGRGIPSVDTPLGDPTGGLMSRAGVSGGMGNAASDLTSLASVGAARRPGAETSGGGGFLPSGPGGTMRPSPPGYNVFNDSGSQGPIFPLGASGGAGAGSSVRRAEGGSAPIRIAAGAPGGSVRSTAGSGAGGGSAESPEDRGSRLQAEGLRLANLGDSAGAIRALQQAQAEFQRSGSPVASIAAENCQREINRLQGH